MAWNCTGMKLASGSVDQTARVWHIEPHGHVNSLILFWNRPQIARLGFGLFFGYYKWSNLSLNLVLIFVSLSGRYDKCICLLPN